MATERYRETASWHETIAFGRVLSRFTDQLPSTETELVRQLQLIEIDLATAVGRDLSQGTTDRFYQLVRLRAITDLVETVYAALDLSRLQGEVQKLEQRLTGPDFEQPITEASPAPEAANASAQQEPPASV